MLRQRFLITNQKVLTDADMQLDLNMSSQIKAMRLLENERLKIIHELEDKERHLQSKYVDEHRAMSDEKQNSAVYFDTCALSWNTNDGGGGGEEEEEKGDDGVTGEVE